MKSKVQIWTLLTPIYTLYISLLNFFLNLLYSPNMDSALPCFFYQQKNLKM